MWAVAASAIARSWQRAVHPTIRSPRVSLTAEHLNERHVRIAEVRRSATRALGAPTYRELYTGFGFPLEELAAQCEHFLTDTEDMYVRTMDALFRRRVGIPLEEAKRWDVPRLFRASEWDTGFPGPQMLPALEATLAGLGIVQMIFAWIGGSVPALGFLHPLNAIAIAGVAGTMAARARREAIATEAVPVAAPTG